MCYTILSIVNGRRLESQNERKINRGIKKEEKRKTKARKCGMVKNALKRYVAKDEGGRE